MRIREWLDSRAVLLSNQNADANLDAQIILEKVLGKDRAFIYTHLDYELSNQQERKADHNILLRIRGIPLPYITGLWQFFGNRFYVSKHVLIPRQETEMLVESAIQWLENHPESKLIADIGTGTGCIVISLAKKFPKKKYYASDISSHVIALARKNIHHYDVKQIITLKKTFFLEGVSKKFDLICANLPYIPRSRLHCLRVSEFEPAVALDGGADGFRIIELLLQNSCRWLKPSGCLMCEIDDTHAHIALRTAQTCWPQKSIVIENDFSGKPRLLIIQ